MKWHKASEPPKGEKNVIVLDEDGVVAIGWCIRGHWYTVEVGFTVELWSPIHKPPKKRKANHGPA